MTKGYTQYSLLKRDLSGVWYLKGKVNFKFSKPKNLSKDEFLEKILSRSPSGRKNIRGGFLYNYLTEKEQLVYQGNNIFGPIRNNQKLGGRVSLRFPIIKIPFFTLKIGPTIINNFGIDSKKPSLDDIIDMNKLYSSICKEIDRFPPYQ